MHESDDAPASSAATRRPTSSVPIVGVMRGIGPSVVDVDDAFLAILGYTRAEFEAVGMHWPSMTPPEFLPLDEAGMRQAAESGGFTAPYRKEFFRRDGSRVPVLLVCAFLPDEPDAWMGYCVDLSSPLALGPPAEAPRVRLGGAPLPADFYMRLVNELVRERTRLLAMLDNTDALIWAVDPELRLLSANVTFQRAQRAASGRDLQVGDSVVGPEFSPPARARWSGYYHRALAGERFVLNGSVEEPYDRRRFDSYFSPIVDPQGRVIGVSVVSQDVTSRSLAERALQASEARFRTLAAAAPLGIFLADERGRILYANPRMGDMWQLAPDERFGTQSARRLHPDDARRVVDLWERAIADGTSVEQEFRLLLPDGSDRYLRSHMAPVREGQQVTGFVGTIDDETERHALAQRARQREKMESLGTLAGGIAHDFNNMLGVVLGHSELALADPQDAETVRESLQEIRTASLRARDLVRQILTFSRRAERELAPVDLTALTTESLRLLRATLPATVTVDARLPDDPLMVLGDASALQQVLLNLCTNAEHAMRAHGGGTLTVQLQVSPDGSQPRAMLTVRDTGQGMPQSVRDRLFEPFFTTKPLGEGTGMGLAVVHGIVDAHGGTIAVESAPGAGATFRVVLPLAAGAGAPAPQPPAPAVHGSGRVLLVEDEPSLARFAVLALGRAGFTVVSCHDGAEALRTFLADPEGIDVLVSDVAMPGLTGDRLMRELLQQRPTLAVVLMTGFSQTLTSERAAALGASVLLQKPFGSRELVAAVRDALAGTRAP